MDIDMKLQYICDSDGKTAGVFIPINDWNEMKNKYKELDELESEIPEWHKYEVRKRLEEFAKNPELLLEDDKVFELIEKDL